MVKCQTQAYLLVTYFTALQNSAVNIENFDCFLNVHGARIEQNILLHYVNQFMLHPCACFILRVKTKTSLEMGDCQVYNSTTSSNIENVLFDDYSSQNLSTLEVTETSVQTNPTNQKVVLKRSNAAIGSSVFITSEVLFVLIHLFPN